MHMCTRTHTYTERETKEISALTETHESCFKVGGGKLDETDSNHGILIFAVIMTTDSSLSSLKSLSQKQYQSFPSLSFLLFLSNRNYRYNSHQPKSSLLSRLLPCHEHTATTSPRKTKRKRRHTQAVHLCAREPPTHRSESTGFLQFAQVIANFWSFEQERASKARSWARVGRGSGRWREGGKKG